MIKVEVLEEYYNSEGRCYALVNNKEKESDNYIIAAGFEYGSKWHMVDGSVIADAEWAQGYYYLDDKLKAKKDYYTMILERGYDYDYNPKEKDHKTMIEEQMQKEKGILKEEKHKRK